MANIAKIVSLISKVGRVERKPIVKKVIKDPELKPATSAAEVIKKEKYLKQLMARPVVRNKDIKKRSTQDLTPNEKRYEKLGEKARVTITKKKPMDVAEIKKTKVQATEKKFDKMKPTSRPKPKPNREPLKPINNSRGSNRPVKPRITNEEVLKLENAKANPKNWDIADQRRPSNIAEGRGNTLQPPSVTRNPIERGSAAQRRETQIERRKAREANLRDRKTDIRESSTPGFEKLQPVKRGVPKNAEQRAEGRSNAEGRAKLTAKAKKGTKMSKRSTTNHPDNAASDAGNMAERLKPIDAKTAANRKRRAIGKGGNKVSPELKAKVEATLHSGKTARKSRQLQNTFNKPKFSRNVTTGKLTAKRPIKPVKK
jgi:hypothetical protein